MSDTKSPSVAAAIVGEVAKGYVEGAIKSLESGQDPVVGGAVNAGIKGFGAIVDAAVRKFTRVDAALDLMVDSQKATALAEVAPTLKTRVDSLDDERATEAAADFPGLLKAWSNAWNRTADGKKRRIIMAALVNAFDGEVYQEGLAITLFELIEKLDYGDLHLLAHDFRQGHGTRELQIARDSLNHFHVSRLMEAKLLIYDSVHSIHPPADLSGREAGNLKVTELGAKMQVLIRDIGLAKVAFPSADSAQGTG